MRHVAKWIDWASDKSGEVFSSMGMLLILAMCYEVLMRYVFNDPQIWAMELPMMLGGVFYAMGWGYVHRRGAHTRVDIIYSNLPKRGRLVIDVIGFLFLFAPVMLILCTTSLTMTIRSWRLNEVMQESYWYPPIAPIRLAIFLGFALLLLQGVTQFFRDIADLLRRAPHV
jgi:TRAP-type mannitol/chloroaromatic compound transport system permease small subunit